MKMAEVDKPGWYFASLGGDGAIECVRVRSSYHGENGAVAWCKMMVESAGYSSALPSDKYVILGPIELPQSARDALGAYAKRVAEAALTNSDFN